MAVTKSHPRPAGWSAANESMFANLQQVRPHEGLGQRTPAEVCRWQKRERRTVRYSSHWLVRRVRSNGQIKWKGRKRFVGEAFVGYNVGLKAAGRRGRMVVRWLGKSATDPTELSTAMRDSADSINTMIWSRGISMHDSGLRTLRQASRQRCTTDMLSKNRTTIHHFESRVSGVVLLSLSVMLRHTHGRGNRNSQAFVFGFRPENTAFILRGELGGAL